MPRFDEVLHHDYWHKITSQYAGQLHGNVVHDVAPSLSGTSVFVATEDGVDHVSIHHGGAPTGWISVPEGITKVEATTDRLYMLSPASGVLSISNDAMSLYIGDYFPPPSGGQLEETLEFLPDSNEFIEPVYPMVDYNDFPSGDISNYAQFVTEGEDSSLTVNTNLTIEADGLGSNASLKINRELKLPVKISIKFKYTALTTTLTSGRPYLISLIHVYNFPNLDELSSTQRCAIRIVNRTFQGPFIQFVYVDDTSTNYWQGRERGSNGWDSNSNLLVYDLSSSTWYIAEMIIDPNGRVYFWFKDEDGNVLEKAVSDGSIKDWSHLFVYTGKLFERSVVDMDIEYFDIDHFYVGSLSSYNDIDIVEINEDRYLAIGVNSIREIYNEPDFDGSNWDFDTDTTKKGGTVVVKNEYLGWNDLEGWVPSPQESLGYTKHVGVANQDLYYVQRDGTIDGLSCVFGYPTTTSSYLISDRRYRGVDVGPIPIPSIVNDFVVYSGADTNIIMMATNEDGAYIIDHSRENDTQTRVKIYGHENIIFHDSFIDDPIGVKPGCWDVEVSANQAVKTVRNLESSTVFLAGEVFVRAVNSETLELLRTYNDLFTFQESSNEMLKCDDKYVWMITEYSDAYDYLDLNKLPHQHTGIARGDQDSNYAEIFDFTQSLAEYLGETAYITDTVRFHKPAHFTMDDEYFYTPVYFYGDYDHKGTELGKLYASLGFSYYCRLLKLNRHDFSDYEWVHITFDEEYMPVDFFGTKWYQHVQPQHIHIDNEDTNLIWISFRGVLNGNGYGGGVHPTYPHQNYGDQSLHFICFDKRDWSVVYEAYDAVPDQDIAQLYNRNEIWEYEGYIWFSARKFSLGSTRQPRICYRLNKSTLQGEDVEMGSISRSPAHFKFDDTYCYTMNEGDAVGGVVSDWYVFKHNGDVSDPTTWPYIKFNITEEILKWDATTGGSGRRGFTWFFQDSRSLYIERDSNITSCAPKNKPPYRRVDKSDLFSKSYWFMFENYEDSDFCKPVHETTSGTYYYRSWEPLAYAGDGSGYEWKKIFGNFAGGKSMEIRDGSTSNTISSYTSFKSSIDDNYAIKIRFKAFGTSDFRVLLENNETSIIELQLDGVSGTSAEGFSLRPIKKRLPLASGGGFVPLNTTFDYDYGNFYELKIEFYPDSDYYTVSVDEVEYDSSAEPYNSASGIDTIKFYNGTVSEVSTMVVDNIVIYNPDDVNEEYSSFIDYPVLNGFTNRALSIYKTFNFNTDQNEAIIYCADPVLGGTSTQIDAINQSLYAYYSPLAPFGPGTDLLRFVSPINFSFVGNFDYSQPDNFFAGSSEGAYLFTKWDADYRTSLSAQRLSYDGRNQICYVITKGGLELFSVDRDGQEHIAYYHTKNLTHVHSVAGGAYFGTTCSGVFFFDGEDLDDVDVPYRVTSLQKVFGYGYDYQDHDDLGWREGLLNNRVNCVHGSFDDVDWLVSTERGVDYITSVTIEDTPFYWMRYSYENVSGSDVCFLTPSGSLYYNIRDIGLAVTYTRPSGGSVDVYESFSISGTVTSGVILGHPDYTVSLPTWPPVQNCHGEYLTQPVSGIDGDYPIVRASFEVYRVGDPPPLVCSLWNDSSSDFTGYHPDNDDRRKPWPPSMLIKEIAISGSDIPSGSYGWVSFDFFSKDEAVYDTGVEHITLSVRNNTTSSGDYYVVGGFYSAASSYGGNFYRAYKSYVCEHVGIFASFPPYEWEFSLLNLPYWSFGADPVFRINCVLWSASGQTTDVIQPDYIYTVLGDVTDIYVLEYMSSDQSGSKVFLTTTTGVYEIDEVRGSESSSIINTYGIETSSAYTYNLLKGLTNNATSTYGMPTEGTFYVSTADGEEGGAFTAITLEDPFVWDYVTVESGGGLVLTANYIPSNEINDGEVTYLDRFRTIGRYIF